jgi:hypothetical protein
MRRKPLASIPLCALSIFACTLARAQQPAAPYPAPPLAPPPAPPYYPPPYPYPYPAQAYEPPQELPYREGAPIPVGYHLEERPRKGLVTGGWIVTAIPYGIGLVAAVSAEFHNHSGWLAVPFAGPWLTMGRRNYSCNDSGADDNGSEAAHCVGDVFVVMGLIADGVMQAAGGTMLLIGYMNPKTLLVRNDARFQLRPMRIGSGHGLGVGGSF